MLLSLPKAAERLDVSAKTVRRLIDRGLLPFARIGRAVKIPAEALEAYIRENTQWRSSAATGNGLRVPRRKGLESVA